MNNGRVNWLDGWSKKIFIIFWFILIANCIYGCYLFTPISYLNYDISDWLINYEGGFVRRGFMGQLLYWLYEFHPFDIEYQLRRFALLSTVMLVILLLRMFRKEGWSLSILPFGFCMFFLAFRTWGRRDMLIFMIIYLLFVCYKHYLDTNQSKWLWPVWFLSVLMLLSHEASFFYSLPIMAVYGWSAARKSNRSWFTALMPFVPGLITMAAVCLYKGNEETAAAIWHSWQPLFTAYPDPSTTDICNHIGQGVAALTWKSAHTFAWHLKLNLFGFIGYNFICAPLLIWLIAATYFMTTRLNAVDISLYPLAKTNQTARIGKVLMLQFVFMVPLFTVLSCDWGRTLPYWVLSSLFALHIFGDMQITPPHRLEGAYKH
jgi:hypothetical protein